LKTIAETAFQRLSQGTPLVLAKITSQKGATPRTAGTQMVVTTEEEPVGTIGGGLVEATIIEQSRRLLSGGAARFERFDLGHADVASMDMICGGDLEILLDPIFPSRESVDLFDGWRQMETHGHGGVFVIALQRSAERVDRIYHALLYGDGRVKGHLPLTPPAVASLAQTGQSAKAMQIVFVEDHHVILEPILKPKTAFVVGAGHVAQPTARMLAMVGFRVVVLDDREAFANPRRFPDVHTVQVLPDLNDPFNGMSVDAQSFIVILTRGHLYDMAVLAKALETEAGYIGMIGSRRKRDAIFQRLRKDGVTEAALQRVHSPIGLDIGAETPAEIAVSIVAEMIAENCKLNM